MKVQYDSCTDHHTECIPETTVYSYGTLSVPIVPTEAEKLLAVIIYSRVKYRAAREEDIAELIAMYRAGAGLVA